MIVHTNIVYDVTKLSVEYYYSMVPIKRTVFLPTVTVLKNTVHLIGTIEYVLHTFYV